MSLWYQLNLNFKFIPFKCIQFLMELLHSFYCTLNIWVFFFTLNSMNVTWYVIHFTRLNLKIHSRVEKMKCVKILMEHCKLNWMLYSNCILKSKSLKVTYWIAVHMDFLTNILSSNKIVEAVLICTFQFILYQVVMESVTREI